MFIECPLSLSLGSAYEHQSGCYGTTDIKVINMEKYDEDLLDNPFFVALQNQHSSLFDTVTSRRYTVSFMLNKFENTDAFQNGAFAYHF